ncbi:hypothetical protein LINPERPRIM_LOCUS30930, partial [Linum perenne]
ELLKRGLIGSSFSPWSCPSFYVEGNAELERGVPGLVIYYKPLNKALRWIGTLSLIKGIYLIVFMMQQYFLNSI